MASTPVAPEIAVWTALLALRAEGMGNEITLSKTTIREKIPARDRPGEPGYDRAIETLIGQGRLKVEQRGGSKQPKTLILLDGGAPLTGVQTSIPGTTEDPFAFIRTGVERIELVQQERLDQHAALDSDIGRLEQQIKRLKADQAELMKLHQKDEERLTQIRAVAYETDNIAVQVPAEGDDDDNGGNGNQEVPADPPPTPQEPDQPAEGDQQKATTARQRARRAAAQVAQPEALAS